MKKTNLLMILDGFGCRRETFGNAIAQAKTPFLDKLFKENPHTLVNASGMAVGLPDGQMGNSEVGHLNIGAGRVVYQDFTRISKAIDDGSFYSNAVLNGAVDHALKNGSALHLMGLLSDGGVHSHITHVYAMIDLAKQRGLKEVYVHALLDGRDVPPRCAAKYFDMLEAYMEKAGVGRIALISGRYYGMDRDRRWERVIQFYDAMTTGGAYQAENASLALEAAYERDETDEFVLPTSIDGQAGVVTVSDDDAVIMFNFRPDRAREITRCFVDDHFNGFERKKRPKNLNYVCMTQYDAEMPNVQVAFPPQSLENTLGEYLAKLGKTQLRIAETEKYAHVTFFFNGGIEAPNNGENRVLVPSPQVATYDLQPEMSAYEVTDRVIEHLQAGTYDFMILNYANPDMVGHTGVMEAAISAIEVLDDCVRRVVEALEENGGQMILTADHGNADYMCEDDGAIVTAHSTSPVPLLVKSQRKVELLADGALADIVPTLLDLADIPQPEEMTGHSLIK